MFATTLCSVTSDPAIGVILGATLADRQMLTSWPEKRKITVPCSNPVTITEQKDTSVSEAWLLENPER